MAETFRLIGWGRTSAGTSIITDIMESDRRPGHLSPRTAKKLLKRSSIAESYELQQGRIVDGRFTETKRRKYGWIGGTASVQ